MQTTASKWEGCATNLSAKTESKSPKNKSDGDRAAEIKKQLEELEAQKKKLLSEAAEKERVAKEAAAKLKTK